MHCRFINKPSPPVASFRCKTLIFCTHVSCRENDVFLHCAPVQRFIAISAFGLEKQLRCCLRSFDSATYSSCLVCRRVSFLRRSLFCGNICTMDKADESSGTGLDHPASLPVSTTATATTTYTNSQDEQSDHAIQNEHPAPYEDTDPTNDKPGHSQEGASPTAQHSLPTLVILSDLQKEQPHPAMEVEPHTDIRKLSHGPVELADPQHELADHVMQDVPSATHRDGDPTIAQLIHEIVTSPRRLTRNAPYITSPYCSAQMEHTDATLGRQEKNTLPIAAPTSPSWSVAAMLSPDSSAQQVPPITLGSPDWNVTDTTLPGSSARHAVITTAPGSSAQHAVTSTAPGSSSQHAAATTAAGSSSRSAIATIAPGSSAQHAAATTAPGSSAQHVAATITPGSTFQNIATVNDPIPPRSTNTISPSVPMEPVISQGLQSTRQGVLKHENLSPFSRLMNPKIVVIPSKSPKKRPNPDTSIERSVFVIPAETMLNQVLVGTLHSAA